MAGSSRSDIISVLKSEIADFEAKTQVNETGRIISINDGIVNIYGLNHAMYGELVEFETGVKGIVQNVERKTLGCVLLGSDHGLTEGSKVVRRKGQVSALAKSFWAELLTLWALLSTAWAR